MVLNWLKKWLTRISTKKNNRLNEGFWDCWYDKDMEDSEN